MDIFQFAMEKEKYSEQYYRKLARRAAYPGLKNILLTLANCFRSGGSQVQWEKTNPTPYFFRTPLSASATAVLRPVCPPNVGSKLSGRSA